MFLTSLPKSKILISTAMLIPENAVLTEHKSIQAALAMILKTNSSMDIKEKTHAFSHTASHGTNYLQNLMRSRLPTITMIFQLSSLSVLLAFGLGSDIRDQPSSKTISLLSGNLLEI